MVTNDLVLLPGLNNTRALFDGVIDVLPAHVRGTAFDCPAHDRVEAIAQALEPMLPQRFWLAGFSFGGYVAMALLDALPSRIQGIALICTTAQADPPDRAAARLKSMESVRSIGYLETVEAAAANTVAPAALADPALMAARRKMVQAYGRDRYLAHGAAALARPDRAHLLRAAGIPKLFVGATEDKVFPLERARQCAQEVPDARFEVVQGSGHLVPMERPEELAAILCAWVGA